jgi:hypothetical protein
MLTNVSRKLGVFAPYSRFLSFPNICVRRDTPYSPSFILDLPISADKNMHHVIDFVFLPSFNDPTMAVLFQPHQIWTGLVSIAYILLPSTLTDFLTDGTQRHHPPCHPHTQFYASKIPNDHLSRRTPSRRHIPHSLLCIHLRRRRCNCQFPDTRQPKLTERTTLREWMGFPCL